MAAAALENNFAPTAKLSEFITENFPPISRTTIRKYLKKRGITTRIAAEKPQLRPEAVRERLRLAQEGLERPAEHFTRTIFIDEFTIDTRKTRQQYVKRTVNQRYSPRNVNQYRIKNPKAISFIVCFCADALGPMALIDGHFNSAAYLSYLANQVIPFGQRMFPNNEYFLLHDNCPIHTAGSVSDFLDRFLPNRVIPHPPYSPDLNPCEHIGNHIKREYLRVQNVPNRESEGANLVSKDAIWSAILRIGYAIHENKDLLRNLATSMHRRYAAVVDARGYYTKY